LAYRQSPDPTSGDLSIYFSRKIKVKVAIILLSDPKSGGEEALGRVFNGLAAAYDFDKRGVPVSIYFQGAATRWPAVLEQLEHPVHPLFMGVQKNVVGVSCGCADVFGARASVENSGYALITDNSIPGTSGLPSVSKLMADGFTVLTF
jgi:hypothetical protein